MRSLYKSGVPQATGYTANTAMAKLMLAKHWAGAVIVAVSLHTAAWWLPVHLASPKQKQPKRLRIMIAAMQPPTIQKPTLRKPETRRPAPRKVKPKKKRVRRKRRWRRKKRRRHRKRRRVRRRRPPRRVVKPRPQPTRPKPVERVMPTPPPVPEREVTPPAPPAPPKRVVPVRPPAPPKRRAPVDLGPYRRGLGSAVQTHKRYPRIAVRMGFEGKAILDVTIARSGKLIAARIVRSSGHRILDREALRMIRAAAPFRAMPSGYEKKSCRFRLPIRFALED